MDSLGRELVTRLLGEHGPALVLFARQWSRSPEDLVQEAVLDLLRQPRMPQRPVPWLYQAIRHRALRLARSQRRRLARETWARGSEEPWFVPTVEATLEAAEATAALAQLPLEQRETIVARLWGGLSFEEVAELTGTTTSTAHRRYQAGLAALRQRLEKPCTPKKNR